jgi:hypothetical protein
MQGNEMVLTTKDLQIGDWVFMTEGRLIYKGFVTEIHTMSLMSVFCIGYYDGKDFYEMNKEFQRVSAASIKYNIYKLPDTKIKDIEDKKHLIDLALLTKDEEWFYQLIS